MTSEEYQQCGWKDITLPQSTGEHYTLGDYRMFVYEGRTVIAKGMTELMNCKLQGVQDLKEQMAWLGIQISV